MLPNRETREAERAHSWLISIRASFLFLPIAEIAQAEAKEMQQFFFFHVNKKIDVLLLRFNIYVCFQSSHKEGFPIRSSTSSKRQLRK